MYFLLYDHLEWWNHAGIASKWFSLNRRWALKKIPSKNIFSSWRKNILKKISKKNQFFQLKNHFFSSKKFTWKNRFFNWKNQNFSKKNRDFFKMIFLPDEKIFFDGIFFKVHLLFQENRSEAFSARFHHSRCFFQKIYTFFH